MPVRSCVCVPSLPPAAKMAATQDLVETLRRQCAADAAEWDERVRERVV